ncbi:MAG: cell division protein FtsQ/DivIB [Gammaproteobacteria bacterium]|nr:cell division protein FtsQ/DivIB [Gammaproteobacteria bacterium]
MSSATFYRVGGPVSPRSAKRGALMAILSIALLAVGLWLVALYLRAPATVFLPVQDVKVDGELRHVDAQTLQQVVTRHLTPGLLQINLDALRTDLRKIAWVEDVSVRRLLPSTLLIAITEHEPVARWGRDHLLGRDGSVFAPPQTNAGFSALPSLVGPAQMQRELHAVYMRYAPWFKKLRLQLAEIELDQRRSWRVTLTDGVVVELGRHQLAQRLQRFASLYSGPLRQEWENVSHVDLRYTNGVAVRWRDDVLHTALTQE